jgi:TPR repeat protein
MRLAPTLRSLALGLSLCSAAGVSYANSYNDGFLAAESGDYQTAVQQWAPLARQGDAMAQFNLALLYHSGSGVEMDEARAVRLYHQSADNGNYYAQEFLTVGYQEGWFGLPKDAEKAAYWRKKMEKNR